MKKIVFFCGILLWGQCGAFFSTGEGGDGIEIQEKKISVTTEKETVSVEIYQVFHNFAPVVRNVQLWEPLGMNVSQVHFFVNLEGRTFDLLSGTERLETLFDQAKDSQDIRFFRLGQERFPMLFRSSTFEISPQGSVQTKITFVFPADFIDDVFFGEVFLDDEVPVQHFESSLEIASSEAIQHFSSSFLSTRFSEVTEKSIVSLYQKENFTPQENLLLFWSYVPNPTFKFSYQDYVYTASFGDLEQVNPQEIILLIDRSGSLFEIWKKVQEILRELLENFGVDIQLRIGFLGEEVEWYTPLKSSSAGDLPKADLFHGGKNTFEFQKDFFDFLSTVKPVGKTDIQKLVFPLLQENTTNQAIVLITDEGDFDSLPTSDLNIPLVVLNFAEDENDLSVLANWSGGFSQKLFRSTGFPEKDEFWRKWKQWKQSSIFNLQYSMNGGEIPPKVFRRSSDISEYLFVTRKKKEEGESYAKVFNFLPRIWGARRMAQILDSYPWNTNLQENIDALLAIGRTFGIETSFFGAETTRDELISLIQKFSHPDIHIWKEILRLESLDFLKSTDTVRFIDTFPVYKTEDGKIWQQFDFPDRVRKETLIEIAPFSEAQKNLFVQFPEFTAEGFGTAREINFCPLLRCVSVQNDFRSSPVPSDRAFWRDFDPTHWAGDLAIRAVNEGFLEPELNGKLHLDKPIDRGAFVEMLAKYLFPKELQNVTGTTFSDLHPEETFHDAVELFVQKGILSGYPDGTFRPKLNITRAEAVKIVLASVGFKDSSEIKEGIFSDVSGWAVPWVTEAVQRGMVSGFSDGTFRPNQELTRAEALKLIFKAK